MKTYTTHEGVLSFDGLPFLEMPVADLLKMGAQEATKSGILIANLRQTFRLSDVNTVHDNQPVEFTVSVRIERTANTQSEADLISTTAARKESARSLKEAKEANGRKEVYGAISTTAVATAKAMIDGTKDPIAEAIRAQVNERLVGAFAGGKALGTGQSA